MDTIEPDIPDAEMPAEVSLRCPLVERMAWAALVVVGPAGVLLLAALTGVPMVQGVIGAAIIGVFVLPFAVLAHRFSVRADNREIVHREFVTRRIPLDRIERIRIAGETKYGIGWPMQHTKIEIIGDDARILVAWRKGRMEPLLRFLEARLPQRIEDADTLPDV
ncbi:MAG: hypothetical protein Tsb0013_06640 [Phycisphaerales bacterium]